MNRLLKVLSLLLCIQRPAAAISLVYNLKIRRSFALHDLLQTDRKLLWLVSAVPVIYSRKRHVISPQTNNNFHDKSLLGGALFNIRCLAPKDWWAELTTGVERQTTKSCGTLNQKASRTGCDDIVLTGGKNFNFKKRGQAVLYGLCGFPTRIKVTPQERFDTLVGTRFFGAGFGGELSYNFLADGNRALTAIFQTRFVHFFSRNWFPILPCNAKIQPGNITDLFLIMRYREKRNFLEVGYNPTFFTQQAALLATGKVPSPNFVRNSFYASATHLFKESYLLHRPGGIGVGCSIGRATIFDTKIASFWINFTLLF